VLEIITGEEGRGTQLTPSEDICCRTKAAAEFSVYVGNTMQLFLAHFVDYCN